MKTKSSKEEAKLLELDFQNHKVITLNDICPDIIAIPLKHVQGKNVRPKTMLYNITKTIYWNDITIIDYIEGAHNNNKLNLLSERFCNNIIFYNMVPEEYLSKFHTEYTFKVALPRIQVLALITSEEAIKSFNDEGIYINDIDFTQDFAGVINKEEVIQYLIDNNDYVMESSVMMGIIDN